MGGKSCIIIAITTLFALLCYALVVDFCMNSVYYTVKIQAHLYTPTVGVKCVAMYNVKIYQYNMESLITISLSSLSTEALLLV